MSRPRISTIKTLFALSCNVCAYPGCDQRLSDPTWKEVHADVAHIRGEKPGAARYDKSMTDAERHDYPNLLLLCPNHHRLIDRLNPAGHTLDDLTMMKARHEERCSEGRWADDFQLERLARLAIATFVTNDDDQPLRISARAELYEAQIDWDKLGDGPPTDASALDDPMPASRWVVVVSNNSERPIFNCHVILRAPHGPVEVNPLEFGTVTGGEQRWPIQTWNVQVPGNIVSGVSVRLLFTDSNNQHWERNDDGLLEALDERPSDVAQREFMEYVERSAQGQS